MSPRQLEVDTGMESSGRLLFAKAVATSPQSKAFALALLLAVGTAAATTSAYAESAGGTNRTAISETAQTLDDEQDVGADATMPPDNANEPATDSGVSNDSTGMPQPPSEPDDGDNPSGSTTSGEGVPGDGNSKQPDAETPEDPNEDPDKTTSDDSQEPGDTATGTEPEGPAGSDAGPSDKADDNTIKDPAATGEITPDEQASAQDADEAGIETFAISGTTFTDVPSSAWYAPYVRWASNQGLVSGYKDSKGNLTGLFGPEDSLTRAELAAMLWRNAGCPSAPSAGFSDTSKHWAKKAIDWCASQGIVTGYDGTNWFGPDDCITREQLCTMLWRNAGYPSGGVSPSRWHDGYSVDDYAWNAVSWAAGAGIMAGTATAPVSLNPQSNATRAEAAKMLAVALGGYEGTSPEHQFLQSLTGWWRQPNSMPEYFYIHDGKIDHYRPIRNSGYAVIGCRFQDSTTLTENDIAWYPKGHFNNGRSYACYAFLYSGNWRLYNDDSLYCWWGTPNYGTSVNHHSMTGSWFRTGAPNIL